MYLLNKEFFESEGDGYTMQEKGPSIQYMKTLMVAGAPLNINNQIILNKFLDFLINVFLVLYYFILGWSYELLFDEISLVGAGCLL